MREEWTAPVSTCGLGISVLLRKNTVNENRHSEFNDRRRCVPILPRAYDTNYSRGRETGQMCPPSARFPPGDPRSNPEPLAQRENANVSGEIPRKINSSRGILFAIVTNFTMGRGNYNLSNFKDPPDRFPKFKLDSCGTRCISRPRSIRVR